MRRNSPKRAKEMRAYSRLRVAFLDTWPVCKRCWAPATEVHHMAGRDGWRLLDIECWMALCHDCHQWITEHPMQAIYQGWSLPRTGVRCPRCDDSGSIRIEGGMPDEVVYDICPCAETA